jgi:type II secretory pathway pseudopilin PulG
MLGEDRAMIDCSSRIPMKHPRVDDAFTLVELLVVISIIIVLMGVAFPAFQGVQNAAKKTQAKNDLLQIVTAVNAYYTEYGKYPLTPSPADDTTYGAVTTNDKLLNELRNITPTENARGIVFLSPPDAKDQGANPRAGIKAGQFYDPWGKPYNIRVDTNYDSFVDNPYAANAGVSKNASGTVAVQTGVIAWSTGKDGMTDATDKNAPKSSDDVISWQ